MGETQPLRQVNTQVNMCVEMPVVTTKVKHQEPETLHIYKKKSIRFSQLSVIYLLQNASNALTVTSSLPLHILSYSVSYTEFQ